jgi:hypothetical protein
MVPLLSLVFDNESNPVTGRAPTGSLRFGANSTNKKGRFLTTGRGNGLTRWHGITAFVCIESAVGVHGETRFWVVAKTTNELDEDVEKPESARKNQHSGPQCGRRRK